MGSVDFPAVISAAATSSLGVLSLIVLVISLLAYGFFRNAGEAARLMVFAPLLLAAVAFGVAVMRESGRADKASAPGVAAAPSAMAPSAAVSEVAEVTRPAATATGVAAGAGSAQAPAQAIAGGWHDDDGYTYRFSAEGGRVSYVQLQDGEPVGSGDGTLTGRALKYRYVDARTNDRGSCEGRLSARGDRIDGRCASGGKSWGFAIARDAA